jgi:hypothetical protein
MNLVITTSPIYKLGVLWWAEASAEAHMHSSWGYRDYGSIAGRQTPILCDFFLYLRARAPPRLPRDLVPQARL